MSVGINKVDAKRKPHIRSDEELDCLVVAYRIAERAHKSALLHKCEAGPLLDFAIKEVEDSVKNFFD